MGGCGAWEGGRGRGAGPPPLDAGNSVAARRSGVPPVAKERRNAAAASDAAPWPVAAARERDGTQARQAERSQVQRAEPPPQARRPVSAAARKIGRASWRERV